MPKAYSQAEFEAAFWARVNKDAASGCWLWTGPLDRKGYGMVKRKGKQIRAHRLSYTLTVGPILGKNWRHLQGVSDVAA